METVEEGQLKWSFAISDILAVLGLDVRREHALLISPLSSTAISSVLGCEDGASKTSSALQCDCRIREHHCYGGHSRKQAYRLILVNLKFVKFLKNNTH